MKKVILACVLLFVAVAVFAQPPSQPPLTREALAAILGQPAASSCATQPSDIRHAAKRPAITGKSLCTATANCESGTVSCSSNVNASSCTAVDVNSNCSVNEPGHVTCDGVTTWCPIRCNCIISGIEFQCCKCAQTGSCTRCCRCNGGELDQCTMECG
ncbi:MAG TPA: hypothetical protein VF173_00500 [Thermoanaerobaculia bacterium]|nr:hypothetical protein [Thermoanaerobaculia bacterium]